ncbi:MAG: CapA family protein [Oscillospiraceae bacterium]
MKKHKTIIIVLLTLAVLALSGLLFIRFRPAPAAPTPTLTPVAEATPSPSPTPAPTPEPTPEFFVLSMVGDCTLAPSQFNDHYNQMLKGDMAHPFAGTSDYFLDDYLTVANLECSFSDNELRGHTTFWFVSPTSYTEILTLGGIDFVTRANNHTDDFGEDGPVDTAAALDAAKVSHAGPNESFVFKTGDGISVGLYCPRWTATQTEVVSGVSALSAREDVDLVVCCMHWGIEGSYRVTEGQAALGHAAIDAGADIVYGSHPHVLQKIEEYGGGYIFNSLGNYSFGGNTNPRDRDTAIVQVSVKRDTDGSVSLAGYTAIPCCLSSTPGVNDYRPVPYGEEAPEWERAMSKLDGSWTGPDLTIDYSYYHKDDKPSDTSATAPSDTAVPG